MVRPIMKKDSSHDVFGLETKYMHSNEGDALYQSVADDDNA